MSITRIAAAATAALICMVSASAESVVDRFARRAGTSCVSFEYTLRLLKGDIPVDGSGRVLFQGSGYSLEGNGLEIFSDGQTRWTMDKAAKEVYIEAVEDDTAAGYMANPVLLLSSIGSAFGQGGETPATFGGKSVTAIALTPLQEGSGILSMTVYFSGETLCGAEIRTDDGLLTVISIAHLSMSAPVEHDFTLDTTSLDRQWVVTDLR